MTATALVYDPYSYEIDLDPYPVWKRMRDEAPVYRNDEFDFWALSRFQDVYEASLDWRTFTSSRGTVLEVLDVPPEMLPQWMIFMDPPRHERLRKVVNRGFTPKRMSDLEPRVRELAARYLDRFGPGDTFDFVQDFGAKLPMMVIGSLLGIPEEDQDQVRLWTDDMLHVDEGDTSSNSFKHLTGDAPTSYGVNGLTEYFARYVADRRANPRDDMISVILDSEIEDDDGGRRPLTDGEVVDFVNLLSGAGNETVARLLGWAGYLLPHHPDQQAHLAARPDGVPNAIEELLRYEPPSPVQARVTTRDVTLHDRTLAAGSRVLLLTGSAGRDDREYDDPDTFDVRRSVTRHVSFGYGIHFCVGAALARLEARIALEEVLKRFPTWEVDEDGAERVHTSTVRGYLELPVTV